MAYDLHPNHWTLNCFKQVVSTKQYQEILDRHGSWVFRNGRRADIRGRCIGPGRYEIWLEDIKWLELFVHQILCGNTFYCPKGHALEICRSSIVSQISTEQRRSIQRLETIHRLQKRIESLRGVQTRIRNRLLRGACPYCNVIPHDMVGHIKARHKSKGN